MALNLGGKVVFSGNEPIKLPSLASDPVSANNGDQYYNTTTNKIRAYQNGSWIDLLVTGEGSSSIVDKITLDSSNILSKSVSLSATPSAPSKSVMFVVGGPVQDYGVDYTISGNTLSWSSLGLDGILEIGDKLIIEYM